MAYLMLSGCEQPVAPPASATLVRAMAVQVTNFDSSGSLTGEIQARYESDLGFRIAGKVVERPVGIGASVTQDQLLARMDNQDQRNALDRRSPAVIGYHRQSGGGRPCVRKPHRHQSQFR
jgi:multidrug efflux pump subunit AcrA (membrane-fusion protein)